MRLDGRVAIVTGGANGIGRGVVRAFVAEGCRVLYCDVDRDAGEELAGELGQAVAFRYADLTDPATPQALVTAALEAFGRLDVLVNNAHASRQAPLVESTEEMLALSFDTGFLPVFRLMQACHPHLREAGGSVINFGSGAALSGNPGQATYAAAKEAVRGLSRVAANEWARDSINVNVICPLARTEGVEAYIAADPERERMLTAGNPMRRLGDPEADIGRVAVFLASEDAAYMTGQTLMVDGGGIMLR